MAKFNASCDGCGSDDELLRRRGYFIIIKEDLDAEAWTLS